MLILPTPSGSLRNWRRRQLEMAANSDLLTAALRDIAYTRALEPAEWDLLLRQARASDTLARVAALIEEHGFTDEVAERPRQHLRAATIYAGAQRREVLREVNYVRKALGRADVRPILLKGAAYVVAGLPAAKGRVFSDLDVLVPKASLPAVESALMLHGWATTHHNAYDQRYYRKWMHELPPFEHIRRDTILDVHHNLLPETARLKPKAELLLAAAVPVAGEPGVQVLSPPDMVLHSMTHLIHNDELSHGLRDLSDMDVLLRHFGAAPHFWDQLPERAEQLDLRRPLYYGLRYASRILATPIPTRILERTAQWAPTLPVRSLMDWLWLRALRPRHSSAAASFTPAALFMLYVRAHWLRMPPLLLFYHLAVKALRRRSKETE
jgi:Uncharacterised nucleotidyltransferase